MGTPHMGADVAAWGLFLGNIGNILKAGAVRTNLLENLKTESVELSRIAAAFEPLVENLQIISVYERKPIMGVMVGTIDSMFGVSIPGTKLQVIYRWLANHLHDSTSKMQSPSR